MDGQIWQTLGIALGLGLLVGLQREWAEDKRAGIRTFPLITLFGVVCALLAEVYGGWILVGGLLTLGAMMVVVNWSRGAEGEAHPGPTTEIVALLMFAIGATLVLGRTAVAIVTGGIAVVLLQGKKPLHGFVAHAGEADLRAEFRLVLIALVILPVVPNQTFGPYDVLNPFHIWLMVVLIVGISLGSYLVSRFLGVAVLEIPSPEIPYLPTRAWGSIIETAEIWNRIRRSST